MAAPPRHEDPVAQAFARILAEGAPSSSYSLLTRGNIALLSNSLGTKVFVDLVSARLTRFNVVPFDSKAIMADPLINQHFCERGLSGNDLMPNVLIDDNLRDFLESLTEQLILQAAHHDDFFFFLSKEETQSLRKIKSNFREGVTKLGLPPGFSAIIGTALATVKMRSTETPEDIRNVIVFCGGSMTLEEAEELNMDHEPDDDILEDEEDPEWGYMSFDSLHIFDIDREIFESWQTSPDPRWTPELTILLPTFWLMIHGFPAARQYASAVNAANKWLFVLGGDSSSVWRLDFANSTWQLLVFQLPSFSVVSAAYCRLSGRLLVIMTNLQREHFRMEMFRVATPSLAWVSFNKVLSLLKPEALAAVHAKFGFGVPEPSVNVAEATTRIMDILYADQNEFTLI